MDNLQALMNGMSAGWQKKRADTQMTLGELITALGKLESSRKISGMCSPDSYRGYYSDLAFAPHGQSTVGELLAVCRDKCMGRMFEGYKGGEFWMTGNTPIFIADYGYSGPRLMGLDVSRDVVTPITKAEE